MMRSMRVRAVMLVGLTACWRGGSTPATREVEPAPVHVATPPEPERDAARAAEEAEAARLVDEADKAFERVDMAAAEQGYRRASAMPRTRVADYARYKLAWVQFDNNKMQEALELFMRVAQRARDPKLRDVAGDDAARVYARIGRATVARSFFQRLDPQRTDHRLQLLVDEYDMAGKSAEAQVVAAQIVGCATCSP
jgi:hypothetical protein